MSKKTRSRSGHNPTAEKTRRRVRHLKAIRRGKRIPYRCECGAKNCKLW
jgi:hypothetical protein